MATGDQINARDWIFRVETTTPDTFVEIGGLNSFTLNSGENEEVADMTLFASQGRHESQPMQRGATLELGGKKLIATGNTPDAGQARVETLADLLGNAAWVTLQFRHTIQTMWTEWTASWVSMGEISGETNDKTSWGCTFTKSGAGTTAAVS